MRKSNKLTFKRRGKWSKRPRRRPTTRGTSGDLTFCSSYARHPVSWWRRRPQPPPGLILVLSHPHHRRLRHRLVALPLLSPLLLLHRQLLLVLNSLVLMRREGGNTPGIIVVLMMMCTATDELSLLLTLSLRRPYGIRPPLSPNNPKLPVLIPIISRSVLTSHLMASCSASMPSRKRIYRRGWRATFGFRRVGLGVRRVRWRRKRR